MARRGSAVTTVPTDADVGAFLAAVPDPRRRRDAHTVLDLLQRVTGEPPVMWGSSIVGFGSYHYTYASGHQGDAAAIGFSPRTAATTVYFRDGFGAYADDLSRLGPHSLGTSCLYLEDLSAVDLGVLEHMARRSYAATVQRYPRAAG